MYYNMGRHFLSVLGTGNYSKATYICEEGAVTTTFIQEAVLKLKMSNFTKEDRISIFVTEQAYQMNWLDRDYTENELQRMGSAEKSARKIGLASILKKEFDLTEDFISVRKIPLGASEEELWEIFNIIYDEIHNEEELYVDITHSLRNIPVQMLSIIMYTRVLKKVSVAGIYYGAFEVGTKNREGITEAQIFDLITFLDILDWSQAARSFVEYGNSDEIRELYHIQEKKRKSKMRDLSKVVQDLSYITQGLETSRGCLYKQKGKKIPNGQSVLNSYQSYVESFQIMQLHKEKADEKKQKQNQIEPLSRLFDVINEKMEGFHVENNLEFGFAAVDWAIENKKTQQGFTALDETIKTWLCCHYRLNELYENYREGICKKICSLMDRRIQKEGIKTGDFTKENREKIYEEWKEGWIQQQNIKKNRKISLGITTTLEEELTIAYQIVMELPYELVQLGSNISNRRNSMNHFGYSNMGEFGCENLYEDLKKYYEQFKNLTKEIEANTASTRREKEERSGENHE